MRAQILAVFVPLASFAVVSSGCSSDESSALETCLSGCASAADPVACASACTPGDVGTEDSANTDATESDAGTDAAPGDTDTSESDATEPDTEPDTEVDADPDTAEDTTDDVDPTPNVPLAYFSCLDLAVCMVDSGTPEGSTACAAQAVARYAPAAAELASCAASLCAGIDVLTCLDIGQCLDQGAACTNTIEPEPDCAAIDLCWVECDATDPAPECYSACTAGASEDALRVQAAVDVCFEECERGGTEPSECLAGQCSLPSLACGLTSVVENPAAGCFALVSCVWECRGDQACAGLCSDGVSEAAINAAALYMSCGDTSGCLASTSDVVSYGMCTDEACPAEAGGCP